MLVLSQLTVLFSGILSGVGFFHQPYQVAFGHVGPHWLGAMEILEPTPQQGRSSFLLCLYVYLDLCLVPFCLTSAFVRGFTLALTFGNVWIWRIKVPNISGEGGASCCHWGGGTKRSSAWGTNWFNSSLGFPRGMMDGNEFGKKGIRIPPRGATARRGVRDVRSGRNVVNN